MACTINQKKPQFDCVLQHKLHLLLEPKELENQQYQNKTDQDIDSDTALPRVKFRLIDYR